MNLSSDLRNTKNVFFIGIKGVAQANLAIIFQQMGVVVSGSDTIDPQITDEIIQTHQFPLIDISTPLPSNIELVIWSAAHGGLQNQQLQEAKSRNIKTMHQAEVIGELCKMHTQSIAICGCHGKTGTTSLLVYLMRELGIGINWMIGAPKVSYRDENPETTVQKNQMFYGGSYSEKNSIFVFEADEYAISPPTDKTVKLRYYSPTHIICTNIDFDHPDIYKDLDQTRQEFYEFFKKAKWIFECESHSRAENTHGIISLLESMGYKKELVLEKMKKYIGVSRRMEYWGNANRIEFYDDYAHHPAEISVTLSELKKKYGKKRIIVCFQSHTFSRTLALKTEFVQSLAIADIALIDPIFPSARERHLNIHITSADVEAEALRLGYKKFKSFTDRASLVLHLLHIMKKGDIILTLGAGDIYKIIPELMKSQSK